MINTGKKTWIESTGKERDEECQNIWEFIGWNNWGRTIEAPHEWKLMVERGSGYGKKRVGGRKNKDGLEGETDEYLEEKTPVEIIEERKQILRTSRMDTRLRTPVPRRRKRVGGWKKNNWGLNLAKMKRLESTWREMHRMQRAEEQRSKNQLREPKEKFEWEEE